MNERNLERQEFEPTAEYTAKLEALVESVFDGVDPFTPPTTGDLPLVGRKQIWGAEEKLFMAVQVVVNLDGGRGPVSSRLEFIRVCPSNEKGLIELRVYAYYYSLKKGLEVSNDLLPLAEARQLLMSTDALNAYIRGVRLEANEDILTPSDEEYADILDDLATFHTATSK